MDIVITGETWIGLGQVSSIMIKLNEKITSHKLGNSFYGESVNKLIIIYCLKPGTYKQRKRYDKSRKILAIDIVFNYEQILHLLKEEDFQQIKYIIGEAMMETLPVLRKYKLENFDIKRFETDFKEFLEVSDLLIKVRI